MTSAPPEQAFPDGSSRAALLVVDLRALVQTDSESVEARLQRTLRMLERVIAAHGGTVTGHFGASLMAAWNLLDNEGDLAVACIDCALDLHDAVDTPDYRGAPLRIGIALGSVIAARLTHTKMITVVGSTVDSARALAEAAAPGATLVDVSTYRLARSQFSLRPLADALPGVGDKPLIAYSIESRIESADGPGFLEPGSADSILVERDDELAALSGLHDALELAADPYLVVVTGETGAGKSRLLKKLSDEVEARSGRQALFGRCQNETRYVPYYFWKYLWQERFGIQDHLPAEDAANRFFKGVLQRWGKRLGEYSAVETAHLVGDLLGIQWKNSPYLTRYAGDPEGRTRRAFDLLRELLIRMSETGPLVLIVDDLQWVDEGSRRLLKSLLRPGPDPLPLLVVVSVNAEYLDEDPDWARLAYRQINVPPFTYTHETVRRAYPAAGRFSDALLARMIQRAGKNPLFMDEIVRSLLDSEGTSSSDISPPVASPIPDSLAGMLRLRLDRLSNRAREVLQLASVCGTTFWEDAIRAAARQPVGTGLLNLPEGELARVVRSGLEEAELAALVVRVSEGRIAGEVEYRFRHRALRDAAYDILPGKYRKFYHFAAAKWLAERAGAAMNVVIAKHFETAGNISTALRYYQYAVDYARSRDCNLEAVRLENQIRGIRSGEPLKPPGN